MAKVKGGARFNRVMENLEENTKRSHKVQIGFFADKKYPDGTSVALVAALNEWGSSGFISQDNGKKYAEQKGGVAPADRRGRPPRPFFRGMIQAHSQEWPQGMKTALLTANYNVEIALGQVGLAIDGQLKQAIRDYVGPPLAPATIAAKGFDKQLVDTGTMLNSVAHKVV